MDETSGTSTSLSGGTTTAEEMSSTGDALARSTSVGESTGREVGCESDLDCNGWEICEAGTCNTPAHVVYLNFEAEGNYFYVPDLPPNAPGNRHNYQPIGSGVLLQDYGTGPKRDQVVEAVRELLHPYRVAITTERPPATGISYGMVVMTERPFPELPGPGPDEANSIGRGSVDCEDLVSNDVSFFFLGEDDPYSADLHARFLTGAILRDTGLASVTDTGHVLHPYLLAGGGVGAIKDECSEVEPGYEECPGMGTGCATGQNAHAWLEFIWGMRER